MPKKSTETKSEFQPGFRAKDLVPLLEPIRMKSDTEKAKIRKIDAAKDMGFAKHMKEKREARTFKGKAKKAAGKLGDMLKAFKKAAAKKIKKATKKEK